jgi:glucosylceramidase
VNKKIPLTSKPASAFLIAASLLISSAYAQKNVEVYLTAKDSDARLSKVSTLPLGESGVMNEKVQRVFVDPTKTFQTVLGIGGALTDASAETYSKLPEAKRAELIKAYYDPVAGIGYSLGRTHIHSCDFSSGSYTYVADGDKELKTFSIAPDETHRLPMIRDALKQAGAGFTMYVSPWSPPAWMKDNNNMLRGGKLLPEFRDAWAQYFVKFIKAYEQAGVPIWGLTVQNEPMAVQRWESCIFTAEEEKDFVRDHLGPILEKSGLGDKKIIIWDHNRTWMFHRAQVALDDPKAAKYIWGVGYHWYGPDSQPIGSAGFENVKRVKETYPNTHLIFTEGCNYPYDGAKVKDWNWGENYGVAMINDFNAGVEGWTDWNILLDETGGPNHVKNFCYAPVHADTKTGELIYTSAFYYIGHFSKFVRPGAKRLIASSTIDRLLTTAFVNTDGSIVAVVMNNSAEAQAFTLNVGSNATPVESPAHSILTLVVR